jgi:hypothetical protein
MAIASLLMGMCVGMAGCGNGASGATQPDAHHRISELFNLYRLYVEKNRKGPANEEALREFGQKLTEAERADHRIGNDLEVIFTSPRDKKKFVVQYNVKVEPSQNRAIVWEETGVGGMRLVALSMGYIVEYDDKMLKEVQK